MVSGPRGDSRDRKTIQCGLNLKNQPRELIPTISASWDALMADFESVPINEEDNSANRSVAVTPGLSMR
jgi:hypothetical protein